MPEKTFYTEKDIKEFRYTASTIGMNCCDEFYDLPLAELTRICNGYGPDRWPDSIRKVLTWVFRNFPEVAAEHDVRYEFSNGSKLEWREADAAFAYNLKIKREKLYPLNRPWLWGHRAVATIKCQAAVSALNSGGFKAWQEAYERRKAKGGTQWKK